MAATRTDERELKLDAPEGFELPALDGEALPRRTFVSTYYDSTDRLLSQAGITLRRRVENGRSAWQLKLPRKDYRVELEELGGPSSPPERHAALLTGILRNRQLGPFAVLRTNREGIRVRRKGRDVADVVLDRVAVLDGSRVTASFDEVEIELVGGSEKELAALHKQLLAAGAQRSNGRPKALRIAPPAAEDAAAGTNSDVLARLLRGQLLAIYVHDPGVRLGDDPEELHDLRVAVRRLRAVLRATRGSLEPNAADELQSELRWLGGQLGPARDLDVLIEHLRSAAETHLDAADRAAFEPLLTRLEQDRTREAAAVAKTLESARYARLLETLERFVERLPLVGGELSLGRIAAEEFRRARKAVRSLGPDPSDEELHAIRIKVKRARYAAEFARPLLGRPAERIVARARTLQDVLGAHQDAVVAEEQLRSLAAQSESAGALAAGRLVEHEQQRRADLRVQFPRRWARLEQAGLRAFG